MQNIKKYLKKELRWAAPNAKLIEKAELKIIRNKIK